MALNIKDGETDALARELADATGETLTTAVRVAVEERLAKVGARRSSRNICEDLDEISKRFAALPVLDDRTPEEIIGYDEHGLPT